jgi:hypothetical protein
LLQTLQSSTASSSSAATSSSSSLAMLQALQSISGTNASDPLLQAIDDTNNSNSDPFMNLLLSPSTTAGSSDSDTGSSNNMAMIQALQGISGTNTNDPLLQAIDDTDSADGTANIFDSNLAMLQALQKSGMSSSQMSQVLNSIETGAPYNQQENSNSSSTASPGSPAASA